MRTSNRQSFCPDARNRVGRSGFTLIELLVVMGIIAIMSGVVLTAISGSDDSQSLDAGITKAASVFSLARSAAITRKTPTRVLIHNDPADPEKFLRFIQVLFKDTSGATPTWNVYAEGEYLPRGIFFSPGFSSTSNLALAPKLRRWEVAISDDFLVTISGTPEPVDQNDIILLNNRTRDPLTSAGANAWYVYEFTAQGTALHPAARVVFVPGIVNSTGPQLSIPNPNLAAGFAVFRGGKAMGFQSIQQIQEGN